MFFKKKKRMIDVRELQKRGVVRIPKQDIVVPTNHDGFVELGGDATLKNTQESTSAPTSSSNTEFFGFMDSSEPATPTTDEFSTQTEGYNKREVDTKISELDNKVYKLENRIELLEKKLDVNQPSNTAVGTMGW